MGGGGAVYPPSRVEYVLRAERATKVTFCTLHKRRYAVVQTLPAEIATELETRFAAGEALLEPRVLGAWVCH